MNTKIFLSHSSRDKSFVRKLDAALIGEGLDVYLDERNIKLGDSIPKNIYDGLSTTTHFVYVISKHSITSNWVEEELHLAKMQEKENGNCIIIPILIDEVEIPFSIKHIKYLDFREWGNHSNFVRGMNAIFESLNIDLEPLENKSICFYINNISEFTELSSTAARLNYFIQGAMDASWALSGDLHESADKWQGLRWALKETFDEHHNEIVGSLNTLADDYYSHALVNQGVRLTEIFSMNRKLSEKINDLIKNGFERDGIYSECRGIARLSASLNYTINEFKDEAFSVVCAKYV